jgi:Right handed beta helix region
MATTQITTADDLIARLRDAEGGETFEIQGAFGALALEAVRPERPVTIIGNAGAHFERLAMRNCANLHWTGISCWPLGPVVRTGKAIPYLVTANEGSAGIEVARSVFRGRKDSDGHTAWTKAEWQAAKIGAVMLRCPGGVIRSNAAIGVNFGFSIMGPRSEMYDNVVFGFSGDGLRAGADNCVIVGNRVTDAVLIDRNHPDAFQAFKVKGLLRGLVIKDNVMVEWTVRPDNPLRAKLQGISLHDGPYSDVVIRDNKVACSSQHGIRVNATTNVEVTGNLVRHIDGVRGAFPRISLTNCRGRIVMTNNEAERFVPAMGGNNREPNYARSF